MDGSCSATVETLEGRTMTICMDTGGVRIESVADGLAFNATTYDCVNSLLLNNSAGFTAHFNSSLFSALEAAAKQQREQPPFLEDEQEDVDVEGAAASPAAPAAS